MNFIKNLFGKKEDESLTKQNQPELEDGRYWGGSPIALFLFNASAISKQVSTAYGQYAEGELLKSLNKALQPDGGWESLKSSLAGFHGDIVNVGMFGESTPLDNFRYYLTNVAYGMSVTKKDLDNKFLEQLKQNEQIEYVVYGVGIGILQTKQVVRTHLLMKAKNVVGYLGLTYFDMDVRRDWGNIYKKLLLSANLVIAGNLCSGWLANAPDIKQAGLNAPHSDFWNAEKR